jgi:hypothetical protein
MASKWPVCRVLYITITILTNAKLDWSFARSRLAVYTG